MFVAFDTLTSFLEEYRYRFVRFASYFIHDEISAEDIFMESVMVFWQKRQTLPADTNIPAYVLGILRFKCIDFLRRQNLEREYVSLQSEIKKWDNYTSIASLESFVPEEVFTREIEDIVSDILSSFPERTRKIYMLSRQKGLSNSEIANSLKMTEKGVEYHITKVNKRLRVALKDYLSAILILFYIL